MNSAKLFEKLFLKGMSVQLLLLFLAFKVFCLSEVTVAALNFDKFIT